LPFFEIGGKLFETEYGPITEKEVFDALDDMTAFYILSEGNFDDVKLGNLERIGMASAHETLQSITRSGMGIGLLGSSLVPPPYGAPVRKTIGLTAAMLEYVVGSSTVDAYMRHQIRQRIKREVDRQRAEEEGRQ